MDHLVILIQIGLVGYQNMNLEELTESFRETVLLEYKKNIYEYIQK